ncbi:helix-turn-helix domain-containing protein [uncultured Jatrophihabitans sp.]|uniref:helix-turn-helix domain-containing protein n=1 Tax=uncultured Jatrophihabitans sp. TaxID=1610747 RepID=UPI0035CB0EE9
MLAAVNGGWTVTELAAVVGLKRHAASKRVNFARRASGPALGVDVPAPLPVPERLAILEQPLGEREWFSTREAWQYADVSEHTVHNWLRQGLLPNTDRLGGSFLILRADLDRVTRAPRYNGRGVDSRALLERIQASAI